MTTPALRQVLFAPKKPIVVATFTQADGALNGTACDTGQIWTAHADYVVASGVLQGGQTDAAIATVDAGRSNIDISSDLVAWTDTVNARRSAIVFRYVDANNHIFAILGATGEPSSPNTLRIIDRTTAGGSQTIATYTVTITSGVVYRVRVLAIGPTITTFLNGVYQGIVTDVNNQLNTRIGYRQGITLLPLVATEMADALLVRAA